MKMVMIRAVLSIWILAVVCMGRRERAHGKHDKDRYVALVDSANKEFAFHLYRKLAAHTKSLGKNIFFSPSSVSVALAALSAGARGETHRQIFNGLGFTSPHLTQTAVDLAFHTLLKRANAGKDLFKGTALFLDNDFKPKREFLDTLKKSYFAEGFDVDFSKTKDSANAINKYVAEKTNGKIDKLVKDMDPRTVMYLISYIYYKGKWETSFDPKLTKEDTFTVDENTKVPVQMMNLEDKFETYYNLETDTWMLRLPFTGSYSMLLLLPVDIATLEKTISADYLAKWLKRHESSKFNLYLPKFSIKTSWSLNDVLTQMGMTNMFHKADLSGISKKPNLAVSEVVHQAALDVDESGATAAAATGVGAVPHSFVPPLKFDRPFMVLITEDLTGNILFMGKIINPNI